MKRTEVQHDIGDFEQISELEAPFEFVKRPLALNLPGSQNVFFERKMQGGRADLIVMEPSGDIAQDRSITIVERRIGGMNFNASELRAGKTIQKLRCQKRRSKTAC